MHVTVKNVFAFELKMYQTFYRLLYFSSWVLLSFYLSVFEVHIYTYSVKIFVGNHVLLNKGIIQVFYLSVNAMRK